MIVFVHSFISLIRMWLHSKRYFWQLICQSCLAKDKTEYLLSYSYIILYQKLWPHQCLIQPWGRKYSQNKQILRFLAFIAVGDIKRTSVEHWDLILNCLSICSTQSIEQTLCLLLEPSQHSKASLTHLNAVLLKSDVNITKRKENFHTW